MVVGHNNVHPHRLSQINSFMPRHTIVHRHNQRHTLLFDKIFVDTGIWTITICKAIGKIDQALSTYLL